MKVVNPKEGKCPILEADEPFILWCPDKKRYYITIVTIWQLSGVKYVIRDTQGAREDSIAAFCIAKSSSGTDLFDTAHEAIEILLQGNYKFWHTRT